MEDSPLVDVVAAVILDAGEYLACRRAPSRGGLWEFPGGKVESGEGRETALKREILEELGIEIAVGAEIEVVIEPALRLRLTTFDALLKGGRPTASTDHDRLVWMRPEGLRALEWAPPDVRTVDRLLER